MAKKKKDNDDVKKGRPKGSKNKKSVGRPKGSKKKKSVGRPKGSKNKKSVGRPKGSKNKKAVGRPKGSKNKKTTANSKKKGFGSTSAYNRVRKLLWANFKEDFNSYREFISNQIDEQGNKIPKSSVPSLIYAQCKDIQCTDEDILNIYLSTRGQEQGEIPLIPDSLFAPQPYWTLITENFYDGLDERLYIVSPMLLNAPPFFLAILGEDRCLNANNEIVDLSQCEERGNRLVQGKKYRFKSFVDYCNFLATLGDVEIDSYNAPHWKFTGNEENPLQAYWNEQLQRWEIEIVPCINDEFGTIDDFGFNPDDLTPEPPDDFELPTPPDQPEPDEPDEPDEPTRTIEQVQIEQVEKTGKLERLEMKKAGILKELDAYINMGERGNTLLENAIDRLEKVNEQIDQID